MKYCIPNQHTSFFDNCKTIEQTIHLLWSWVNMCVAMITYCMQWLWEQNYIVWELWRRHVGMGVPDPPLQFRLLLRFAQIRWKGFYIIGGGLSCMHVVTYYIVRTPTFFGLATPLFENACYVYVRQLSYGIVERESWMVQYLTRLPILSSWLPSLLTVILTKAIVGFIIRARHCIKYHRIEQYWKFKRVQSCI